MKTPVILSGAPLQTFHGMVDGRGVEGSLHSGISRSSIKAFSRESSEAASPGANREVFQQAGKNIRGVLRIILTALLEIFDENAYERFLSRTHSRRSTASYREFLLEREAATARKPRCC
jgi:hypothetical protein